MISHRQIFGNDIFISRCYPIAVNRSAMKPSDLVDFQYQLLKALKMPFQILAIPRPMFGENAEGMAKFLVIGERFKRKQPMPWQKNDIPQQYSFSDDSEPEEIRQLIDAGILMPPIDPEVRFMKQPEFFYLEYEDGIVVPTDEDYLRIYAIDTLDIPEDKRVALSLLDQHGTMLTNGKESARLMYSIFFEKFDPGALDWEMPKKRVSPSLQIAVETGEDDDKVLEESIAHIDEMSSLTEGYKVTCIVAAYGESPEDLEAAAKDIETKIFGASTPSFSCDMISHSFRDATKAITPCGLNPMEMPPQKLFSDRSAARVFPIL